MPIVRHVDVARTAKRERRCAVCGHEIKAGESYKYVRMRRGYDRRYTVMRFWCSAHRPSKYEFVNNEKTRALMEAEDTMMGKLAWEFDPMQAEDIFQEAANSLDRVAAMHEESAENIREGFGHETSHSTGFEGLAAVVREAANRMRNAAEVEFPPEPETDDEEEWEGWRGEVRHLANELVDKAKGRP